MKHLWAPWRMTYLQQETPKMDGCLFCRKLDADDREEHILYRGEHCFVVLNRFPYNNGHLMVVPYQHVPSLSELDDATALELMQLVGHALRILGASQHPSGFNIGVNEGSAGGAGVADHVHMHVVPRWDGDANYITVVGDTRVIPEDLDATYARLRPRFDALR